VVFVATTAVTLWGSPEGWSIKDGYLSGLVTAFLLESAAAVIAVFRKADFFPKEPDGLAALGQDLKDSRGLLPTQTRNSPSVSQNWRCETRERDSAEKIARISSLRLRVLAVLGARSTDARGLRTNWAGYGSSRPCCLAGM